LEATIDLSTICQFEDTIDYLQLERLLKEAVDLSIGRNYPYVNRKRLSICQLEGTIGYCQSEETTDTSIGINYRCHLEDSIDCQMEGTIDYRQDYRQVSWKRHYRYTD
jgi:hypothetical protein